MAHLLLVLEERANDYLFFGLDSAEPVKASLKNVSKIINGCANHAIYFSNKMTANLLFLSYN
jgi:hypothetical protein